MAELKPCPFCGSTSLKIDRRSKFISYRHVDVFTASVRCNVCHARGGTASGECGNYCFGSPKSEKLTTLAEIEQRAIKAWNRRAGDGNDYYKKQSSCTTPDGKEWFASGGG